MDPEVIFSPLDLTDAAGGCPTTAAGEVELTMNLPDVTEYQLFLGFHTEVLTELAAPAEEVGGQQDGGGETGLLGHFVGLHQVGLDRLVREEGESDASELKYQDIIFPISSTPPHLPYRQHSGMSLPCGGLRNGWSAPSAAPDWDWGRPDTGPGPGRH